MKKKLISCALCVLVLVTLLAVPISAAEQSSDEYWQFLIDNANPVDYDALRTDKSIADYYIDPDIRIDFPDNKEDWNINYTNVAIPEFRFLHCVLNYTLYGEYKTEYCAIQLNVSGLEDGVTADTKDFIVSLVCYWWTASGAIDQFTFTYHTYDDLGWRSDFFVGEAKNLSIDVYLQNDSQRTWDREKITDIGFDISYPYLAKISVNYIETDAYQQGFNTGYDEASKLGDGAGAWMNMKNLIFVIFDAPFYVISQSLNFDLFGINIAGTLIALISVALLVWCVKLFVGK